MILFVLNTKIWLEELSFGSNFGNRRAIYIFKIQKVWIEQKSNRSNGSRNIAKSLKISFGFIFVSLRVFGSKISESRFPLYTFQTKISHFTRSQVLVYRNFADGRTDRHFSKKFSFFLLIKNIYTCLYLSRLFFKFQPNSDQS